MSLPEGTPGSRTTYQIEITAREKEAVERFLTRKMVAGDASLVEDVMQKIAELPKKELADTPPLDQ